MNTETYDALIKVMALLKIFVDQDHDEVFEGDNLDNIAKVEAWIDKTGKGLCHCD